MKSINDNKKAEFTLALGHLSIDTYSAFINPIMPFIVAKLGITLTCATVIISIAQLCSAIIQPLFGYMADILEKRFFVFWGLVIGSIFLSLTGIADNIFFLTLCLALGSIGVAFFHPQATSFVKMYSQDNPTKWMSVFLAAGTIGYSAGPLISSYIVEHFGLSKLPFSIFYGILVAFLTLSFVPKVSSANSFSSFRARVFKMDFFKTFFVAVSDSFKNDNFKILFSVAVAKCLIVSSYCVFLPFLWKDLNYSVSKIGFYVFLFVAFGAIATVVSPFFEKIIGSRLVFYFSMLPIFPLALVFALTYKNYEYFSIFLICLIGFFAMLAIPVNMVLAQRALPQYKGLVSGFIGGFSWGLVGIFLPLTGYIAENIGISTLICIISIVPLVVAFFVKYLKLASAQSDL